MNKMQKKILTTILIVIIILTAIAPMTVFANWEKQSNGSWKYYSESEGDYLKETILKVDGKAYYFDSDGWMQTGWIRDYDSFWAGVPYDWYYANSKGELQTGWQYIDGKWYYFDENDYSMYYGGDYLINGKYYFFYPAGAMGTGWIKKTYIIREEYVYTIWYYANSSGELQKGWQKIGGVWYYFDPESFKMTDYGCYTINGKTYYFDENGKMGTGWCKYDYGYGSDWYYANSSGALQKGWQKIGGVWYYFDEDYAMLSNIVCSIDGIFYAFSSSGAWISGTGWQKFVDIFGETKWIYTRNGKVLTGWQMINGTWYYFYPRSGYMVSTDTVIDGKVEQFNSSGAWLGTRKTIGWGYYDCEWYYVEDTSGNLAKGWRTINGVTYYFSPSSATMFYDDGSFRAIASEIDGKYYHFDENGALRTGRIDTIYGYSLYADENGELQRGWLTIDGNQYYCIPDDDRPDTFVMYCDGIFTIDDVDYYFDENGVCQGEAGHVD